MADLQNCHEEERHKPRHKHRIRKHAHDGHNDDDHDDELGLRGSGVEQIEVKDKKKKKTKKKNSRSEEVGCDVTDVVGDVGMNGEESGKSGKKKKKRRRGEGEDAGVEVVNGVEGNEEEKTRVVEGDEAGGNGGKREGADADGDAASSSGRFTISMAVAGSIVDNAQSFALASRLAGQIARAAAIFRIDEIVVFDDGEEGSRVPKWSEDGTETSGTFLTRLLKYMETPQYLRQTLFPRHPSLQFAGSLPPLDVPHQARKHEWIPYREGAVTTKPPPSGGASCVNVGLYEDVVVRQKLELGTRVTVKMGESRPKPGEARILEVVPKSEPRDKGHYWGYTVRHASSLSTAISESTFPNGYDYIIGTSEHGEKVRSAELTLPKFKHILIVFGGVAGLEESKELDKSIKVTDVRHLFNIYLNVCPGQGSRTIRTEEAILISLQYLQDPLMRALDEVPRAVPVEINNVLILPVRSLIELAHLMHRNRLSNYDRTKGFQSLGEVVMLSGDSFSYDMDEKIGMGPHTGCNSQHDTGRTGRAGKTGISATFLTLHDSDVFYVNLKLMLTQSNSPVPPELAKHEASKFKERSFWDVWIMKG